MESSAVKRKGQLVGQCVPISCLKLVDGSLLVIAEGPCLLLTHPKKDFNINRFQLFPNQCTITGFCFVEESCGYPCRTKEWNGPSQDHSLAVVWSGTSALLVTIHRPTCSIEIEETYPFNSQFVVNLNYIPITAKWFDDGRILSFLAVFNYIVAYDRESTSSKVWKQIDKWECEKENLYSGAIQGEELSKLVVFSGTTFKGILVWIVENGEARIIHRLVGHKGIPFSLEFNSERNMLLSASDDRTVIVWEFTDREDSSVLSSNMEELDDKTVEKFPRFVKISQILKGHESRVWKAIWINFKGFLFVVSVGEDSNVRSSSFDKSILKNWKAHDGAPVYACEYDQLYDFLYTSAHDGSIYKWKRFYVQNSPLHILYDKVEAHPFTEHLVKLNSYGRSAANNDHPRNVCSWGTEYLIVSMDSGRVIAFNFANKTQTEIFSHPALKRYNALAVSRQNSMLAFGGLKGECFILRTKVKEHIEEDMPCRFHVEEAWSFKFPSKIINIHWLADDARNLCLIALLDRAYLYRFFYGDPTDKLKLIGQCLQTFQLQLERPEKPCSLLATYYKIGILKSVLLTKEQRYMIVGDEVGSISVFPVICLDSFNQNTPSEQLITETKNDSQSEKQSEECACFKINLTTSAFELNNIHKEGVTSIVEYKAKIMTSGRYGGIKTFNLEHTEEGIKLVQTHEFSPPFEWIAKLAPIVNQNKEEMLVCGFLKGSFLIYSWEQKRVLNEIENLCGGHRRWDFAYEFGMAALTFLRDKELYFSITTIQDSLDVILKPGLHSRSINCGVMLGRNEKVQYLATGSEDGSIRVLKYETTNRKFYPLHRINNHASSIRVLVSVLIDQNHVLLFSGGGRSEMYATVIGLGSSSDDLRSAGKVILIKTKNRESDVDTRVMDISIIDIQQTFYCACACSDGIVRILSYTLSSRKFKMLHKLKGENHCITKVQLIQDEKHIRIFATTSNGYLLFWNLLLDIFCDDESFLDEISPTFVHQVRQCAIMSMKVWKSSSEDFYLVIGDDGCSVSLWKFKSGNGFEVNLSWSNDQLQRGAVIGLSIHCDNSNNQVQDNLTIFSCSNDQVICHWDLQGNLLGSAFGGVSDCQGFIVSVEDDLISCFGDGMSWITCP